MSRSFENRRGFLKSSTAAASGGFLAPYFFSRMKTSAQESVAKNDRISLGLIGAGQMGVGNMLAAAPWCDVTAICDVDSQHAARANHQLSDGKADVCQDYRQLLERDDIDVLHVATPDHWHAKVLVEGMRAGKDVYCEKPLTLTIDEGKLVREVQRQTGRVVQVGTQQRSTFDLFTTAIALVQAGRLGRIHRIEACIGDGPTSGPIPVSAIPASLDWDRWLGPAAAVEYRYLKQADEAGGTAEFFTNGHNWFRWWYAFSGGRLTDWGAHHVDIGCWALEANGQREGPLSIGGTAVMPVPYENGYPIVDDRYNTATQFVLTARFPGDTELIVRYDKDMGVLIEGDQGRIFVNRGKLVGAPVDALRDDPLPEDAISKAYRGLPMEHDERVAHWANFFHCVKARKTPISDVHSHMRSLNVCHLANIAARLGRTIQWNAANEQVVGDDQAEALLARAYRSEYEIEA